jgi:hypothetical protein
MSTPLARATTGSLSCAKERPIGAQSNAAITNAPSAQQAVRRVKAMERDPLGKSAMAGQKAPIAGADTRRIGRRWQWQIRRQS